ncbi:MAG: fused MFS/spermidine synthase [Oscillospiraceae bacterium]|nr:fused MFS/spermidine synthase [Oscillospiraceae bacterium]
MEKRKMLQNKWFLYLTEFFSGMGVMAVELGASRLLAPYFSSSQIVWTIIIGTIMIAMAIGNMWGGKQADKSTNPDGLYKRILIASLWIAAIPLFGKYLIMAISAVLVVAVNENFLIVAAFLACMLIFVFPLFLLGTVTPSLAKYAMSNVEESGKTVGVLNACNTIGSIIGTFMPTFVTIPAVGTAATFLIFSGILLLLSLIYFAVSGTNKRLSLIVLILFVFCAVFGNSGSFAFWRDDITYEGESIYNYLQVTENDRSIALSTNVLIGVQSIFMKQEGLTGMYYDYALAAPVLAGYNEKEEFDILILGMGCGTYATLCEYYYPVAQSEGVEIDEKITDLARTYFSLPSDVKVTTYDGRACLQSADKKYDLIMVDAYQDITIPFQMSSLEFFRQVSDHLKEDGAMVVNLNMRSDEPGNINEYLCDTIASVFSEVYTVDVPYSENRELFAFHDEEQTERLYGFLSHDKQLRDQILKVRDNLKRYEGGDLIFTDEKAPVELLGMRVIDSMIGTELEYFKKIMEEEGVSGLLQAILS